MAASFATKKGYKKGAVIYVNNDWGNGLKEGFDKDFKAGGGEVVSAESVEPDLKDFRTVLIKVKSMAPDFVYIPVHPDQAGVLLKQAKELSLKIQFLGADSFSEKSILTVAGTSAEGVIFTMPAKSAGAVYDEFQKKYKAKFNSDASYISAAAYDAVMVIAKALTEAGVDADKIKVALGNIKNYQGASGDITFDKNGDVVNKKFDLLVIKNSEYVPFQN
jgi:branched-chain amino acid transport system substrate-binding protein